MSPWLETSGLTVVPDAGVASMSLMDAIVLGIVQGVTEFLPVSSSGHLLLARHFMGLPAEAMLFDAVVHFGSLLAIVAVFRHELVDMLHGLRFSRDERARGGRRLLMLLGLATLPLVAVGLLARHWVKEVFSNPVVVPVMLFVTAGLLVLSERFHTTGRGEITVRRAVLIGLAQVLAVLPGLSRSGTTIAGGMLLGLDRERATRFSFLLAIPAILGVTVLELRHALTGGAPAVASPASLVVGTAASAIATFVAVVLFLRFVRGRRLTPFAVYCAGVGGVLLLVQPW
ncbi:MAG: undecaprenyl-diphosphatase UppP [Deltaproteobacteria bacterium]|nr:MAG: undecaprenyl-diphosphatase UppP [Deltaproteobacteria bacterium]